MKLGVTMITTDQAMDPARLALAAESRGFNSVWFPQHTHIPTSRRTPAPTGEPLDEWYKRMLDPYVALGAAAAVTNKIQLGTGVALIAQAEPISLAKQIATVDHLSGGRLRLGIGFGWNDEEMSNHGIEFSTRRERVEEHLAAMRAIWSAERAEFRGRFVEFDELWSWPKCAREVGPPVLIGGAAGPRLFDAIARYADGWMPVGGATLGDQIAKLHEAVERAGRNPESISIVPFGSLPTAEKLEYFESIGVSETVLRLPSASAEVVEATLDEFAGFLS